MSRNINNTTREVTMNMRRLFIVLLIVIGNLAVFGQPTPTMSVTVSPDLANITLGSITVANNLPTTMVVFQVNITGLPNQFPKQIAGKLTWIENENASEEVMARFITNEFREDGFNNTDLGHRIRIPDQSTNDAVIEKNVRKGKPVGTYKLELLLFKGGVGSPLTLNNANENHPNYLTSASAVLAIPNIVQNLSISEPTTGSIFDAGNVTASWNPLEGISSYKVKANYLRYPTQSPEDALRSGEALIEDKDVGLQTSVNLRTLMTREWTPGKTVVMQVYGVVSGVGQENIYSQPVTFIIRPQMSASLQTVINNISVLTQTFTSSLPPELLAQLGNGSVVINEIRLEDGSVLSEMQVQAIITYLQQNPNNVLNVTFRQSN